MKIRFKVKWILVYLAYLIILSGCNSAAPEQDTSNNSNQSNKARPSESEKKTTIKNNKALGLVDENIVEQAPVTTTEKKIDPEPKKQSSANLKLPLNIKTELPDFSKYKNTVNKKKAFFAFLEPIIVSENKKVLEQRDYILSQFMLVNEGDILQPGDIEKLEELAVKYRIFYDEVGSEVFFDRLLMHVDIIPPDLALAQAANESAWGSSYFAKHGNNLFGQWCFTPGCGIVPRKRQKGDTHEVAVYDNLTHSIASYIQYLNSHPAFKKLRQERYEARKKGSKPSGYDMATGLKAYSARGMNYVKTLQSMIKKNKKYMGLDVANQSGQSANTGS